VISPKLKGNSGISFDEVHSLKTVKSVKWYYPPYYEYRSFQPGSNLRRYTFLLSLIKVWPKALLFPEEIRKRIMTYVDLSLKRDGLVVESPYNSWSDALRLYDQDLKLASTKTYGHLGRACTFGFLWVRFFQFDNGSLLEICGRVNPDIALYVAVNTIARDLCLRVSIESVGAWVSSKYQMDDIYVHLIGGPGIKSDFNCSDPGPWTFFRISGWSASKCLMNLLWVAVVGSFVYGVRPFIFSEPSLVLSRMDFEFEDITDICQVGFGRIKLRNYQSAFRSMIVTELMGGGTPFNMSDRCEKTQYEAEIRLDRSQGLYLESGNKKSVVHGDLLHSPTKGF